MSSHGSTESLLTGDWTARLDALSALPRATQRAALADLRAHLGKPTDEA
ncbi:hypothetical protein [Mycolicibacterium mengxianglii]|nr:hypothetical protein [Mycolicibacterium mengxianglii]